MPPLPTWHIVIVIVRLGRRFLLVQERKHGEAWYLPGGRVEPGESLIEAAVREAREEAGILVVPDGVYRIEHTPNVAGPVRLRVILTAHPADDDAVKDVGDEHSLGARWATVDEVAGLTLRSGALPSMLQSILEGAPVYPLSLLGRERRR